MFVSGMTLPRFNLTQKCPSSATSTGPLGSIAGATIGLSGVFKAWRWPIGASEVFALCLSQ